MNTRARPKPAKGQGWHVSCVHIGIFWGRLADFNYTRLWTCRVKNHIALSNLQLSQRTDHFFPASVNGHGELSLLVIFALALIILSCHHTISCDYRRSVWSPSSEGERSSFWASILICISKEQLLPNGFLLCFGIMFIWLWLNFSTNLKKKKN